LIYSIAVYAFERGMCESPRLELLKKPSDFFLRGGPQSNPVVKRADICAFGVLSLFPLACSGDM
jgi:hypothetical protein